MTIIEALQWANNKLRKSRVESPMLDAEILLAHALGVNKVRLFSHSNDKIKTHLLEKFQISVDRRASREPIAYIIGEKEFYGRLFNVNPSVLIPRPETETLIDESLAILKTTDSDTTLLCDIGTGSGAIVITLASETQLSAIAIDIDDGAIQTAKENSCKNGTQNLIDFRIGNLAAPLINIFKTIHANKSIKTSSVYPYKHLLITANLPYLKEQKIDNLQPEVRNFEPRVALVSGEDGLDAYRELFTQLRSSRKSLPRKTTVIIEIDPDQTTQVVNMISIAFPDAKTEIKKDLRGDDRVVIAELPFAM
jgi:release factor glutamine methyltransferase